MKKRAGSRSEAAPKKQNVGRARTPARPSERRSSGLAVEERACEWLRARGYRILARNHSCRRGEVDIVAVDGDYVVFVEVRSKRSTDHGTPAESISFRKRRRIIAAATDWLVKMELWDKRYVRFDVLAVVDGADNVMTIEHLSAAFDETGALT